jgi:hypothetical protein
MPFNNIMEFIADEKRACTDYFSLAAIDCLLDRLRYTGAGGFAVMP